MIRTQVLKHIPGAREGERGESKEDARRGVMEKSRYIRITRYIRRKKIEGEKKVDSAIRLRRANRGSINIEERKRGRVV